MKEVSGKSDLFLENQTLYVLEELYSRNITAIPNEILKDLIEILSLLEKGKITEKITNLLKRIVKSDKEKAVFMYTQSFSAESLFLSIFKESCLKAEGILELLDNSPSEEMFDNAVFYAKGKDERSKEIFKKILPHLMKNGKIDELISLHERHGWTDGTTELLNTLIQEGKTKHYTVLLGTCKDIPQLCNFLK